MYNAENPTAFTREQCDAAVGKRVSLTLTGKVVKARESGLGPYVVVEIDQRFGLPDRLGMDLDAFEVLDT